MYLILITILILINVLIDFNVLNDQQLDSSSSIKIFGNKNIFMWTAFKINVLDIQLNIEFRGTFAILEFITYFMS